MLSGQMCAIAIKPLLCLLHHKTMGLVLREPDSQVVLSVYANNVILITQETWHGWRLAMPSIQQVNCIKSSGLTVRDEWQVSFLSPMFCAIQWGAGLLLYLGVYLSTTDPSVLENWRLGCITGCGGGRGCCGAFPFGGKYW